MMCEKCGKTKGEAIAHSYTDATCTTPPICRYCIAAGGEPLGHDWIPATCLQGDHCARCNATKGNRGPHTLGTSTDGKTKPCTVCGASVEIQYVALTFDDGPSGQVTKDLLKGLEDRNAKATFFLCGYRISLFPDYPELIHSYGHEIGLHTENHAYLSNLSSDDIRRELTKELDRIPDDIPIRLMRPPGGHINGTVESICSNYGLSIIMWSLDTQDWNNEEPQPVIDTLMGAKAGDIILMHDIKENSVNAALEAIEILQAKGYEFVTVSELAALTGRDLYGGGVYYAM